MAKSKYNGESKFAGFIFACLRQIDADPQTSAHELRLAWVISQYLNRKTRVCFPLQSTLAQRLDVKERAVRGYVAGLVARGHLRVRHRGRDNSAEYELVLQDRQQGAGLGTTRPADTCRSSGEDRQFDVARPANSRRKTGTTVPVEPTSVTNLNNQAHGARQARQCVRPSVEDRSSTPIKESAAPTATARGAPIVGGVEGGDDSNKQGARVEILPPEDGGGSAPPLYLDNTTHEIVSPQRAKRNTTAPSNRERAKAMAPGDVR